MKKLFIIPVLMISLFTLSPLASASTFFSDVHSNHYAFEAIKWAKHVELVGGYGDGTFKPNQKISEQQFARMLVTYFDLDEAGVEHELSKNTPTEKDSDVIYNTLATYGVPLNGFFDNRIRSDYITRGVVAQALGYVVDGQTTLDESITFLLDAYISTGQNSKYEDYDVVKYFGAENTLTRAQAVSLFYRLSEKNYFYISNIAQETQQNFDEKTVMTRASEARSMIDEDFAKGSEYTNPKGKDKDKLNWNGLYSFKQRYGSESYDVRGLQLTITNSNKSSLNIEINTYDGLQSDFIEGTATLVSDKKAVMHETTEGDRCMIELQKLDEAIRIVELDCAGERDHELSYAGTVVKQ